MISDKTSGTSAIKSPAEKFKVPMSTVPRHFFSMDKSNRLDLLWSPKPSATKLFVLFSGDALRAKYDPPVYQRWSWAKNFPGHCLYISDPSLYCSDKLGLAWYAGNAEYDPLEHMSIVVKKIIRDLNLTTKDIIFYGSSGGGHAAIRSLTFFPKATAIAINPQTSLAKYHRTNVDRYLSICYPDLDPDIALEAYAKKFDLTRSMDFYHSKNILIAQNDTDTFHLKNHCEPFIKKANQYDDNTIVRFDFSLEGGHGKGESEEVYKSMMEFIMEKQ